jgi:hypothetical protein
VGESYSLWDAARGVWHQSWVTNRGTLLLLDGRREGGRMVLAGPEKAADGTASLLRGIWWVEGKDVREKADRATAARLGLRCSTSCSARTVADPAPGHA